MSPQSFETEWAGRKLKIEVGRLAQQTNGSCVATYGETSVLATVVKSETVREGIDFMPLLVDYEERFYAAGRIKGSRFIKKEGRPSDEAVLTGRLVDRSIRPLFPQEIRNDIQVILTVLSFDNENDPDIISLIAASCALAISDIPWNGPIAAIRLGQINNEWVLNSTYAAREKSLLDLVVSGTGEKILMIEAEGKEVPEKIMLEATRFARKHLGPAVDFLKSIQEKIGLPKQELKSAEEPEEWQNKTNDLLKNLVPQYFFTAPLKTKQEKQSAIEKIEQELISQLEKDEVGKDKREKAVNYTHEKIKSLIAETMLLKGSRIDGRALDEIRPLSAEVGLFPHTHGSALFNRGETQILSMVTLGAPSDEQFIDTMEQKGKRRYFHHYNFPPFCVGEVSPLKVPGRREIGHGALAEKALLPMLPDKETFPYTIRVVSEVLSSNGSSSMGSVCGSSLTLMDAGVPIKKPVAGIAMGLVSEEKNNMITKYRILTDLQDLEDGEGGMDFKIAGTSEGITAIQLDTKTQGLTDEIVEQTLDKAKEARLKILDVMQKVLSAPRPELAPTAPRIISLRIDPEKIRDVIGPGGKMINEIIDTTGATIDVEDDGLIMVTSASAESAKKAVDWIKNITREVVVGEIFQGRVTRILDFGAFVEILPKQEGLVHISELAPYRVNKVHDVVQVGQMIPVKVIQIDDLGRINLSLKQADPNFAKQK
jgi:polyribonucleotide nucleotidyltransferase